MWNEHQIQPGSGDEQADTGRDCQTKPSREAKSSGANADGEKFIFSVQLTTCRMCNLTRLIHTLAICVTLYNVEEKPTIILYTTFIAIVVSHLQRIGRQSEKLLYTVANPVPRGLLNRDMYTVVCTRYR